MGDSPYDSQAQPRSTGTETRSLGCFFSGVIPYWIACSFFSITKCKYLISCRNFKNIQVHIDVNIYFYVLLNRLFYLFISFCLLFLMQIFPVLWFYCHLFHSICKLAVCIPLWFKAFGLIKWLLLLLIFFVQPLSSLSHSARSLAVPAGRSAVEEFPRRCSSSDAGSGKCADAGPILATTACLAFKCVWRFLQLREAETLLLVQVDAEMSLRAAVLLFFLYFDFFFGTTITSYVGIS